VLIRGGTIVDGTGAAPARADVRIRGGAIAEIGPALRADGERPIDASGAYVAPGFIDVHTHYDAMIWWDPAIDPAPQHGITSVVTGNCALSLAPLLERDRAALVDMFCFIEDMPTRAVQTGVPFDWTTFAEYRKASDARGAAVNVAPLVGHNNLRLTVMGEAAWERPADDGELEEISRLLAESLAAGGFGVSVSFVDLDSRGRSVPSRLADPRELDRLAATLAAAGHGLVEYVPRFMKLDRYLQDVDKVDRACRPHGVAHTVAPLIVGRSSREMGDAILRHIAALRAGGSRAWAQASPRVGLDRKYGFDGTAAQFAMMPSWVQAVNASGEAKRRILRDPDWRARARGEWDTARFTIFPRDGFAHILVAGSPNPAHAAFLGRSLADVQAAWNLHPSDVLARWIDECDLQPRLVTPGDPEGEAEAVARVFGQPGVIVGASDAGAHIGMFCGMGDPTLLLIRHVRERGDLRVEQAVHELTGKAADLFGIRDRGRLAPGHAGDVTIFALDELVFAADELVVDVPGGTARYTRPAGGYRYTLVGGEITQAEGRATQARPGRFLSPQAAPQTV
jgi:N-acyl-D-aspartate/D-glutamate deacylase